MKRRFVGLLLIGVVALLLVACAGRMEQSVTEESFSGGAPRELYESVPAAEMAPLPADLAYSEADMAVQSPEGQAVQERLIIRTGDMSIVATDTEATLARIAEMAESGGGWVVSSNIYQSTETAKTGYIQVRIPAEGFQSMLDAIAGLAVEVTSLNTSGQDVTEEYVDLDARLGNLEATADRLRTFLDEARTVEEALAVNQELSRVEGEIESLKGRMQYLEQSSAFSSVSVNVTPDELSQPIQVGGWQPTGVAKQAVEALIAALQWLANAVIWFAIFVLPVLAIIAIPFVLIIWLIRRLRRRERATTEAERPEPPVE